MILKIYQDEGFHGMVCSENYFGAKFSGPITESTTDANNLTAINQIVNFHQILFVFSKIPELFDTAFIVLRKQRLILLHWYHHLTVLWFAFYCCSFRPASSCIFSAMNFSVHFIMYSYYAVKCKKLLPNLPKFIPKTITTLQILQMVIGTFLQFYILANRKNGCYTTIGHIASGFLMYFSYLILFCKFFVDSYVRNKNKQKQQQLREIDAGILQKNK